MGTGYEACSAGELGDAKVAKELADKLQDEVAIVGDLGGSLLGNNDSQHECTTLAESRSSSAFYPTEPCKDEKIMAH